MTCYGGMDMVPMSVATNPDGLIQGFIGHGTIPQNVRQITQNAKFPTVRAFTIGISLCHKMHWQLSLHMILKSTKARCIY